MKKLICLLAALLVAPAMAGVTISVVDNGDLTADIVVTVDGDDANADGSLIAGIALDVSVDAGAIVDVFGYKTSGESVAGDEGYGIFMGTITFTGDNQAIADSGTPVAPASAPDNPGQLGSSAIVLEFGALWDQTAAVKAAPAISTVLCTIAVSEECEVTIGSNATRGGVVRLGGAGAATNLPIAAAITGGVEPDCYTGPDFDDWVAVGKPASWCAPTQCHGDADGQLERIGRNDVAVGYADIAILLDGFNKIYQGDPIAQPWIAADFDHKVERIGRNDVRVGYNDINILLAWFNKLNVPQDCLTANPVKP